MKKLTHEQAIAITGYTGILAVNWAVFQADVQKRLGRPVFTHEFGDEDFQEDVIKKLYRDDFMAMLDMSL